MLTNNFIKKFTQKIQTVANQQSKLQDQSKLNSDQPDNKEHMKSQPIPEQKNQQCSEKEQGNQPQKTGNIQPIQENTISKKEKYQENGGLYPNFQQYQPKDPFIHYQSENSYSENPDEFGKINLALYSTEGANNLKSNPKKINLGLDQYKSNFDVGMEEEESFDAIDEQFRNGMHEGLIQKKKIKPKQPLLSHRDINQFGLNERNIIDSQKDQGVKPDQKNQFDVFDKNEEFDNEAQYLYQNFYRSSKKTANSTLQVTKPDNVSRVPDSYLRKIDSQSKKPQAKFDSIIDIQSIPKSPSGLTDGRQYNQLFRRSFVAKILASTKNMKQQSVNEVIRLASHKIQVHAYEIRSWLAAYQIIFIIEAEQEQKSQRLAEGYILKRIGQLFLSYFIQNKAQKRYRLVKTLSYVFKNFGFAESRVSSWLNRLVLQNQELLSGVDFASFGIGSFLPDSGRAHLTPTISSKLSNPHSDIQSMTSREISVSKPDIMKAKKSRKQIKDAQQYPNSFKQNVAMRIDFALKNAYQQIMKEKSQEFCLPEITLNLFHEEFGRYTLITKDVLHSFSQFSRPPPSNHYVGRIQAKASNPKADETNLTKLQARLSYFIKNNQNFHVSVLQKQADTAMQQFGFSENLKNQVRKKWFAYFLKKHNIKVPQRSSPGVKQQGTSININKSKIPLLAPQLIKSEANKK